MINAIAQKRERRFGGGAPVFMTEDWWTVGTNQCANVVKRRLTKHLI